MLMHNEYKSIQTSINISFFSYFQLIVFSFIFLSLSPLFGDGKTITIIIRIGLQNCWPVKFSEHSIDSKMQMNDLIFIKEIPVTDSQTYILPLNNIPNYKIFLSFAFDCFIHWL